MLHWLQQRTIMMEGPDREQSCSHHGGQRGRGEELGKEGTPFQVTAPWTHLFPLDPTLVEQVSKSIVFQKFYLWVHDTFEGLFFFYLMDSITLTNISSCLLRDGWLLRDGREKIYITSFQKWANQEINMQIYTTWFISLEDKKKI